MLGTMASVLDPDGGREGKKGTKADNYQRGPLWGRIKMSIFGFNYY